MYLVRLDAVCVRVHYSALMASVVVLYSLTKLASLMSAVKR